MAFIWRLKMSKDKEKRGRPCKGASKRSLSVCVRVEPHLKDVVFEKFGGWQAFFDHYAYRLVPKELRPKKKA